MLKLKNTLLAAALAFGAASSAQALTVTPQVGPDNIGGVTFTNNVNDAFSLTLAWDPDLKMLRHTTQIGFDFDLSIAAASGIGNGVNNNAGFFVIAQPSGIALENSTSTTCADRTANGAQCNLLNANDPVPQTIFSDLSAGFYTFGVFGLESDAGSITFGVSKVAPVPLPAAGFMLLGALGGTLALRRRRKA